VTASMGEKIRKIYETLPKLNCGFCGYENCAQLARAVAEGRASLFACRQTPWTGQKISDPFGAEIPVRSFYGFQPGFGSRPGVTPSLITLKEEVRGLSQRIDDVLVRIEKLKARK
jgi:hypothetical protein